MGSDGRSSDRCGNQAEALQLDFSGPGLRAHDQPTSVRAAAMQTRPKLGRDRLLALCTLSDQGPLTDYELADATGRQQNSIGRRRTDLVRRGLVEATAERRRTPSGAFAIVWGITAAGQSVLSSARREVE